MTWAGRHPAITIALALLLTLATLWAVNVGKLALSLATNADYWSRAHGQGGGLLYVALGDSAAQGIGASQPEKGYVGLLAQRMRDTTGQPVQVINLSRSGARVHDVIDAQLPALAALGRVPDVVTVGIGGNDVRGYDRATFADEAERLMSGLPDGTYVADAPYYMHGHWEVDAQQAADILTASAERRGLHAVALHDALRAQGSGAMLTQYAADWFHPNDRGHRVWADAFWKQLADDRALASPN